MYHSSNVSQALCHVAFGRHRAHRLSAMLCLSIFLTCRLILLPFVLPCFSHRFRINPAWLTYCSRIVSVLFPLLEARMIEWRKKEEKRKNEGRYGNNTGLIRDRYETGRSDLRPKRWVSVLSFSSCLNLYNVLHFAALPCVVSHAKIANTPMLMRWPLYKDNLPPTRMQAD